MSYPLSHTTTKYISLTPVAHYDFSKLNLTVGTPISSVPCQTSGTSLSSLNLSECPVMEENILADGTTVRVASFNGAQKMYTVMDSPVVDSAADDLTMIVVATGTTHTGGEGGYPTCVWNRNNGPHGGYNTIAVSTNGSRSFSFGNFRNISPGARGTYSNHKQLNFVEGQWFMTQPADSGDSVGYTTRHGTTVSTQMNIGTDVPEMSAYGTYNGNTQWIGSANELIVGARSYGSSTLTNGNWYHYTGHVAEVLVFDGLLTNQDRQKIRDYVQEKYDVRRTGMVGGKCLSIDGPSQYAVLDGGTESVGSQLRTDYHTVTGGLYPGTKFYNQVFDFWLNLGEAYRPDSKDPAGRYSFLARVRYGSYQENGANDYAIRFDAHSNDLRIYSPNRSSNVGPLYYVPKNRWFHVRLGVDFVSDRVYFWLDGELVYQFSNHNVHYYWNRVGIQSVIFGDVMNSSSPHAGSTSDSWYYFNAKQKIGGFRAEYTKEPLSAANFIPPTTQSLPNTTSGGDFTVERDDMGLKPLYDSIVTTDDITTYPKLHGKWRQSVGSVFGNTLYAQYRNMPDLIDFSNPNLKSAFRYCHVNLNNNQIKTLAPLKDVFEHNANPEQAYHLYLNDNRLTNFKDMKGSNFFNNGNWYNFHLQNNPISSFEGLEEINSVYGFYAYGNRCLQHIDHVDQASWSRLAGFYVYTCANLLTITPSAFQHMPQLDSIQLYNNPKLSNAPVLHFDGVDQSNNYYYAYFYSCNITDFSPLKSNRLVRLDNYNQQHSNIIDMSWLGDCNYVWEWNGSSNDYNLSNLPDLVETRLNKVYLQHTNITDPTFLTTAIKGLRPAGNTFVLGVSSDTDAIYDTLHLYDASLSATHMTTLGADPTKKISIVDELVIYNNPELRDLRVFENSFNFPTRNSWHNSPGHHYAYLYSCNLTNDSFSIGAMREWWQCLRLYIYNNPNLTSLSELFTNNTSIPRSTYYDTWSFKEFYAYSCAITDVSWMLNDSFAGVKYCHLGGNPIDHSAFAAIAPQLIALKTSNQIRLEEIVMTGTMWDNKHMGGGWWYNQYPTHPHTIRHGYKYRTPTGEIDPNGHVYTASLTAAEYFRCTNQGSGSSLSVQAQTAKSLHDAGIKVSFTAVGSSCTYADGTHYHPHALPSTAEQWGTGCWACPIPYPPVNA